MQQRRVNLPQLKMPLLLLIRISALALLIGLGAAEQRPSCSEQVPTELIRDLWKWTKLLIDDLPKEDHFSRKFRLLPKFCIKCPERGIGWLEMRELIDIYQRRVFGHEVVQKLLPPHYNAVMHRLQHTLRHCVSSSGPSKYFKLMKKLEKKINKKKDEGALKAVGEFTFVLRWLSELTHHHVL